MHALPLSELLTILCLGATLGFLGGLFGIGGGIIAIPFLVLAFGMEQATAQGTSLAMMVPILLIGWWRYSRRHPIPVKIALQTGLLAVASTLLVAYIATNLNPTILTIVFSIFLLLLALRMLVQKHNLVSSESNYHPPSRLMPLVGLLGGGCMGLLGIGGGLLATPIFTGVFRQKQTTAQSLSLALVTPSSIIALIAYGNAGRVDWSMGLPLAIGGLLTVSAGVALAHRLPERQMRLAFAWMLLCTAIWLLTKQTILN